MKKQSGYVFRKGDSWFVRYRDTFVENGEAIKRQVARKLATVEQEHMRLKKPPESVLALAHDLLAPINDGVYQPGKHITIADFVERVYFPNMEGQKRASTLKGYRARWGTQLAARCGHLRIREFDTPAAQRLLNDIGRSNPEMCRSTLHHLKSLLSAIFRHAIQQGYVKGVNPIRETSIPRAPEGEETWAYSLSEVMKMLRLLPEPARTIVAVAAFVGLRRSEIRGLLWEHYTGDSIQVMRSVWEGVVNEPKTRKSKAPVPVILPVRRLLDQYRSHVGHPATGVIFATMKKTPLSLNNVLNRQILPVLNVCFECGKSRDEHGREEHSFERDASRPAWHGWHAFRRGLATNLHDLGVDDKTVQAILRHSNVAVTQNAYIKTLPKQSIEAMRQLESVVDANLLNAGAAND